MSQLEDARWVMLPAACEKNSKKPKPHPVFFFPDRTVDKIPQLLVNKEGWLTGGPLTPCGWPSAPSVGWTYVVNHTHPGCTPPTVVCRTPSGHLCPNTLRVGHLSPGGASLPSAKHFQKWVFWTVWLSDQVITHWPCTSVFDKFCWQIGRMMWLVPAPTAPLGSLVFSSRSTQSLSACLLCETILLWKFTSTSTMICVDLCWPPETV